MTGLYYERRSIPEPHPALVVASRARRKKARYISNPGRRRAAAMPVAYDYGGTPHESGFLAEGAS